MDAQEFESLMDDFDNALANARYGVDSEILAFRYFMDDYPEIVALIRERECEMHQRVRLGYDKTVADSWRAEVDKRDERIAKLEALISDAEMESYEVTEDSCCRPRDACPWCAHPVERGCSQHYSGCRAFSAPGVVR